MYFFKHYYFLLSFKVSHCRSMGSFVSHEPLLTIITPSYHTTRVLSSEGQQLMRAFVQRSGQSGGFATQRANNEKTFIHAPTHFTLFHSYIKKWDMFSSFNQGNRSYLFLALYSAQYTSIQHVLTYAMIWWWSHVQTRDVYISIHIPDIKETECYMDTKGGYTTVHVTNLRKENTVKNECKHGFMILDSNCFLKME